MGSGKEGIEEGKTKVGAGVVDGTGCDGIAVVRGRAMVL